MAITWEVEREQATGLTTKSVWALLTDGVDYRRAEIPRVPIDADPVDYAQSVGLTPAIIWALGAAISAEVYEARQDVKYRDYFISVGRAIKKTLNGGGTIGQALNAGGAAIAADTTKQTQFLAYAAAMGLSAPSTQDEKRQALLMMKLWALEGFLQAVLLGKG